MLSELLSLAAVASVGVLGPDGQTDVCLGDLQSSERKPLLSVGKEDAKWQFGSSNQECHSASCPLPAAGVSLNGGGRRNGGILGPFFSFLGQGAQRAT